MRLSDDELTALLEAHHAVQGSTKRWCFKGCGEWPCQKSRLATEIRELRTVKDAAVIHDEWHECDHDGCPLDSALARYEEGGR